MQQGGAKGKVTCTAASQRDIASICGARLFLHVAEHPSVWDPWKDGGITYLGMTA